MCCAGVAAGAGLGFGDIPDIVRTSCFEGIFEGFGFGCGERFGRLTSVDRAALRLEL